MLFVGSLLATFAALPQASARPAPPPVRVVAIDLARHPGFDWRAADLDVYVAPRPGESVLSVLADDQELARLSGLGLSFTVVHEDLSAFYRSRLKPGGLPVSGGTLGAWLTPPFAAGGMGGYYTLNE